ncbi:MAG TPA: hypothetical protein VFD92_10600 [Candidatus Binatia bacterium]|nr:hypothetical protein [Candidatus Binatia bacterium]
MLGKRGDRSESKDPRSQVARAATSRRIAVSAAALVCSAAMLVAPHRDAWAGRAGFGGGMGGGSVGFGGGMRGGGAGLGGGMRGGGMGLGGAPGGSFGGLSGRRGIGAPTMRGGSRAPVGRMVGDPGTRGRGAFHVAPPPGARPPAGHLHHGGGGKCFSRHHGKLFGFFFTPLVAYGFAYPYWYDYPWIDEPAVAEPDVFEFEPFYTGWSRYPEAGAFICRLFVTPEAWLLVLTYFDQRDFVFYFDPVAQQFVGSLERATGDFRHWYGDATGWGDPEPFPYAPPPPLD